MLRTYVYKDLRIASDTRAKELIYMRKPTYVRNAVCFNGASSITWMADHGYCMISIIIFYALHCNKTP